MSVEIQDKLTITEPTTEPQKVDEIPSSVAETSTNGSFDWTSFNRVIEADIRSVEAHLHRINGNGHKKPEAKKTHYEPVDMGVIYTVEEAIYTAEPENVEKTSKELRWVLKQDIEPEQYAQAKDEYLKIPQDRDSLHTGWIFDTYLVYFMTMAASESRPSVTGSWKALDKALHKAKWYQEWHEEKYPAEHNLLPSQRTQYSELKNATINDIL